jgi:hypothetical protein
MHDIATTLPPKKGQHKQERNAKKKALRRTGFDYFTIRIMFRIEHIACTYTRDPHLLRCLRWEGDSIPLAQRRFVASLVRWLDAK